MKESRKYVRRRTSDCLQVVDKVSGRMLARLLNLSPQGLKVISAESLEAKRSYSLVIKLPKGVFDRKEIELSASVRWSRFDKRTDMWECGLEIGEVSENHRKLLQQVVLKLMAHDGESLETFPNDVKHEKIEHIRMPRYK